MARKQTAGQAGYTVEGGEVTGGTRGGRQQAQSRQDQLREYLLGSQQESFERPWQFGVSDDPLISSGQIQGLQRGQAYYGQTALDTGTAVQDIVRRRRERLEGTSPGETSLRESRNRRIRQARGRGASPEEIRQIERESEKDIGREAYRFEGQNLQDYQELIGNILGGQTSLEMGYAGLEKSGEYIPPPRVSGGGLTVICTELHRQGYMSDEMRKKDQDYGRETFRRNPDIYFGYIHLVTPVVRLMKKSKLFTRLVSIPAMAWARNMAGEKNFFGGLISKIGEPTCAFVWRMKNGTNKHYQIEKNV